MLPLERGDVLCSGLCSTGRVSGPLLSPLEPPRPSPELPGQESRAEGGAAEAHLFLSQHGASSSTDQRNETRAHAEARANPGAKASWNSHGEHRNHGEQLTRMQ